MTLDKYRLFSTHGVLIYHAPRLATIRAIADCFTTGTVYIRDDEDQEYLLGRYRTGNLFNQPEQAESEFDSMSWDTVKKAAAGPFVQFDDGKDTKTMFIAGEPEVIKARSFGGGQSVEEVGVLPVLLDGKFKVLALRSSRLRKALEEKWEVIDGKMVDITRVKDGFDTTYAVKLSKKKKKPDAKLIAVMDKAFAAFIKENKQRVADVDSD